MNGARSSKTGTADITLSTAPSGRPLLIDHRIKLAAADAPPNVANNGAPVALLIDARQAAAVLRLGRRKLWSLTICGAIPSRRIGRAVRYAPSELETWIANGCPTEPRGGRR